MQKKSQHAKNVLAIFLLQLFTSENQTFKTRVNAQNLKTGLRDLRGSF